MGALKSALPAYIFLLGISLGSGQWQDCDEGEECIPLRDCREKSATGARGDACMSLVADEACGFADGEPMVCCPQGSGTVFPYACGRQPMGHNDIQSNLMPSLGAYPWLVFIRQEDPKTKKIYHFSGSVINSRYVLSSGGALHSRWKTSATTVILGARNVSATIECVEGRYGGEQCFEHLVAGVEKIVYHPHYDDDGSINDDIGLMRLNLTLDFNDRNYLIEPICLAGAEGIQVSGARAILSGWRTVRRDYGNRNVTWTGQDIVAAEYLSLRSVADCKAADNLYFDYNKATCAIRRFPGNSSLITHYMAGQVVRPSEDGRRFELLAIWSNTRVNHDTNEQNIRFTLVSDYRSWIVGVAVP